MSPDVGHDDRHRHHIRSTAFVGFQASGTNVHCTEPVFLNAYGARESIPRDEFRQPMQPGGPIYDNPIPTRCLAPKDCLKIPAQSSSQHMKQMIQQYMLLTDSKHITFYKA